MITRRSSKGSALVGQKGSVVLFTLFACLATALCVQIVSSVLLCGQRALAEENSGRDLAEERDEGIMALRERALALWQPGPWVDVHSDRTKTMGRLADVEGGEGWVLQAEVIQDTAVTSLTTSAWLERGRDGLDLPGGALVAARVLADPGRVVPWLTRGADYGESDAPGSSRLEAVGFLTQIPELALTGPACSLVKMDREWELDDGWRALIDEGCLPCNEFLVLVGSEGETLGLPDDLPATSTERPALVVVSGGADLDARGIGDIYGVLVVDGGSVFLEGTIVHGALVVSGDVRFGLTGQVDFCCQVLRWATDRSLERVRVVPGTRREGTE